MTNSVKITQLINEIKDGVDNSAFGPMFTSNPNDITKKAINQLPWAIFMTILAEEFKKNDLGQ